MEILKNEILPLFNQFNLKTPITLNILIPTSFNEYTIYVTLEDVYNKHTQSHLIPIHSKRVEYNIPVYYHQIVLSNKGSNSKDLIIQFKTIKHDRFLRVNSHDLLITLPVPLDSDTITFNHLDKEPITVHHENEPIISKISEKGLPKPDGTRGDLFILLNHNSYPIEENLLAIMNYDTHSNVTI